MKRIILIILIAVLCAAVLSCDKNDITTTEQLPGWLQQKIMELIPDQNLCEITDVTIIRYKGETYYHLYCGIWSCMYCHLYDEKGNRPAWDEKTWNDFYVHQEEVRKVPACKTRNDH